MTDALIVVGLVLLLVPLMLVSVFLFAPVAGVVLVLAGCVRSVGEKGTKP